MVPPKLACPWPLFLTGQLTEQLASGLVSAECAGVFQLPHLLSYLPSPSSPLGVVVFARPLQEFRAESKCMQRSLENWTRAKCVVLPPHTDPSKSSGGGTLLIPLWKQPQYHVDDR